MLPALTKAHDRLVEALNNFKAEQNRQVSSSEEIARLREELKTEELQQLAHSVKKSLKDEEESDQKFRTAALVLTAEHVICCAEFNKHQTATDGQPDLQPLSEKVKQLTKEMQTLNRKAGKFSGALDALVKSLQDLSSDLALLGLGGPVIENPYLLAKIFSYLEPASVKNASLVSR